MHQDRDVRCFVTSLKDLYIHLYLFVTVIAKVSQFSRDIQGLKNYEFAFALDIGSNLLFSRCLLTNVSLLICNACHSSVSKIQHEAGILYEDNVLVKNVAPITQDDVHHSTICFPWTSLNIIDKLNIESDNAVMFSNQDEYEQLYN